MVIYEPKSSDLVQHMTAVVADLLNICFSEFPRHGCQHLHMNEMMFPHVQSGKLRHAPCNFLHLLRRIIKLLRLVGNCRIFA